MRLESFHKLSSDSFTNGVVEFEKHEQTQVMHEASYFIMAKTQDKGDVLIGGG